MAHASDGEVDHFIEFGATFSPGQVVSLRVESPWRALGARYHSGGHLIAALAEKRFGVLHAVAGHHWPGEARVEFECDDALPGDVAAALSDDLVRAISANLPVCVVGDPYANRSVQIGDFAPVACGGTHVRTLSALYGISIEKARMKSGKLRVSYSVPDRDPQEVSG